MSEPVSRLRQELWRTYIATARTLRTLQVDRPMVQGSLRRAARKPSYSDDLKTVCVFGCQSRRTAPDDWSPSMG